MFYIFTRVENQPLKQRLNKKKKHYFDKRLTHFLIRLAIETFFVFY